MQKALLAAGVTLAVFVIPDAALGKTSQQHVGQYLHDYHIARQKFGAKAVGCNLIEKRGSCHMKVTDAAITKSDAVLRRMLAPPPVVRYVAAPQQPVTVAAASDVGSTSTPIGSGGSSTSTGGGSSLVSCIISHESGGNSQAVNGIYSGIGQWSQTQWQADGGTGSPTSASYQQQYQVLVNEGSAGQEQQQGQWDGC